MHILILAAVVLVGMFLPAQAGINATLRQHLGHPILAGVVNFTVGLIALLVVALVLRLPLPDRTAITAAPPWAWLGGLLGASLVVTSVIAAPRLGAALLVGGLVAGQLISSLIFDHFGWVGYPERGLSFGRLAGVVLLGAGVYLLQRSS